MFKIKIQPVGDHFSEFGHQVYSRCGKKGYFYLKTFDPSNLKQKVKKLKKLNEIEEKINNSVKFINS